LSSKLIPVPCQNFLSSVNQLASTSPIREKQDGERSQGEYCYLHPMSCRAGVTCGNSHAVYLARLSSAAPKRLQLLGSANDDQIKQWRHSDQVRNQVVIHSSLDHRRVFLGPRTTGSGSCDDVRIPHLPPTFHYGVQSVIFFNTTVSPLFRDLSKMVDGSPGRDPSTLGPREKFHSSLSDQRQISARF
jgi:hypothetical protein